MTDLASVTVCELPHQPRELEAAWRTLCSHTTQSESKLVVLPEFAFCEPLWLADKFDQAAWSRAEQSCNDWLTRLPQLNAAFVIGARPVTLGGRALNQGFMWSDEFGLQALRAKYFLPDEAGGWEARWFDRGDRDFPLYRAGELSFGLNICTELWALDTYRTYARAGAAAIIAPRATAAATTQKWLSIGTVAAVASGAYCLSSNRVHDDGSCGGAGWIIDPDGQLLARTSAATPFCTREIDLALVRQAGATYPRYVFADKD